MPHRGIAPGMRRDSLLPDRRPFLMPVTLAELNQIISKLAPPAVAESWDNVGLQCGDPQSPVDKALLTLEVSAAVIDEAAAQGAQAIISHHPLVFHALKSLVESDETSRLITRLIRSRMGLISAHTNLDKSVWGTNYALADAVGAKIEHWLRPDARQDYVKMVVFTPEGHEGAMIDAIARAGGGVIGNYTRCTFRAPGTGTFQPQEGANPFLGEVGQLEETKEWRLETLVPRRALADVLREVRATHPYEEPALDVMPVELATTESGLGVVAMLDAATALQQWKRSVDESIRALLPAVARETWEGARIVGDPARVVQRVAICSGSGGSVIEDAARSGCDCLLTGEIGHHDAIEARTRGLCVLLLGHFASEAAAMPFFARALEQETSEVTFAVAQSQCDPLASVL